MTHPLMRRRESSVISVKEDTHQVKFRWPQHLIDAVADVATATNRSVNEAGMLLMRWAVERAKEDLGLETKNKRK